MGGKTGTTTSSVAIPPEVLARYNDVNAQAQATAGTPFQQYSTDPNAFVAPLNEQQNAGINNINQQANAAQPGYQAAMAGTANAAQGFNAQNYQQGVQAYMNPYLQNAMGSTAAYLQNQNQQQQNQLQGNAISSGAFGGDRGNVAQAALMGQQNLAMGQTLGQMANQGYQQSAQNYMTGLQQQGALANQYGNLAGQAQQMGLAGAQAQLGAGTLGQQTTQAGQTALYNQFQQQQAYPFQVAQFLANIAEGTGALSGSTTTQTAHSRGSRTFVLSMILSGLVRPKMACQSTPLNTRATTLSKRISATWRRTSRRFTQRLSANRMVSRPLTTIRLRNRCTAHSVA